MDIDAKDIVPVILPLIGACLSLLSGLCATAVRILWKMSANIAELNEKMAAIMSKLSLNDERTARLESSVKENEGRLRDLELRRSLKG